MLELHATPLLWATLLLLFFICLWWFIVEWGFSKPAIKSTTDQQADGRSSTATHDDRAAWNKTGINERNGNLNHPSGRDSRPGSESSHHSLSSKSKKALPQSTQQAVADLTRHTHNKTDHQNGSPSSNQNSNPNKGQNNQKNGQQNDQNHQDNSHQKNSHQQTTVKSFGSHQKKDTAKFIAEANTKTEPHNIPTTPGGLKNTTHQASDLKASSDLHRTDTDSIGKPSASEKPNAGNHSNLNKHQSSGDRHQTLGKSPSSNNHQDLGKPSNNRGDQHQTQPSVFQASGEKGGAGKLQNRTAQHPPKTSTSVGTNPEEPTLKTGDNHNHEPKANTGISLSSTDNNTPSSLKVTGHNQTEVPTSPNKTTYTETAGTDHSASRSATQNTDNTASNKEKPKYQTAAKARHPSSRNEASLLIPTPAAYKTDNSNTHQKPEQPTQQEQPKQPKQQQGLANQPSAADTAVTTRPDQNPAAKASLPPEENKASSGTSSHTTLHTAKEDLSAHSHTRIKQIQVGEQSVKNLKDNPHEAKKPTFQHDETNQKSSSSAPIPFNKNKNPGTHRKQSSIEVAVAQKITTKNPDMEIGTTQLPTHTEDASHRDDALTVSTIAATANSPHTRQAQVSGNSASSSDAGLPDERINKQAEAIPAIDADAALRAQLASSERQIKSLQSTLNSVQQNLPAMTATVRHTPAQHNRPTLLSKVRVLDQPKA